MTKAEEPSEEMVIVPGDPVTTTPAAKRTPGDYVALAIATCGVGYLPLAPGTWGSLVGIGFYFVLKYVFFEMYTWAFDHDWFTKDMFAAGSDFRLASLSTLLLLIAILGITLLGTWAASRTEMLVGRKDPSIVVVDEVAGQLVAFIFLPHFFSFGAGPILIGFVAFRFFDIVKPYPARRFEALPGGLGIMADDLVAGAYAALVLSLINAFSLLGGIVTAW
jgi:phosphatidylglycerophosphatase A